MKPATVAQIKKELTYRSPEEITMLCLRLARFKKENKELLSYLLFESENEEAYVQHVKEHITEAFTTVNTKTFYFAKKGIRKVLRETKKFIRHSTVKETEVVLLLFFCEELRAFRPSINRSTTMRNLYDRQLVLAEKKTEDLHEDLQYDYQQEIEELREL